MAGIFETAITLQGIQIANTPPFIRLTNKGLPGNFIEFFSQAQEPDTSIFPNGQRAIYTVDFTKYKIHLSDDPIPDPPPPPQTGGGSLQPIKPPYAVGTRSSPPHRGYFGNDGSPLVPTNSQGQINGFSGTSKTNDTFVLKLDTELVQSPGRVPSLNAEWLLGHIQITKQSLTQNSPPNSLIFTIGYCPSNNLALVSLSRGNGIVIDVGIVIDIDLNPLELQQDGSILGYANLTRTLVYHDDIYSSNQAQMPFDSSTTGIYFPARATQWPVADSLEYFFDAVVSVVDTLGVVPANTPLINFASIGKFGPPPTLDNFIANASTVLTPAFGPLAAGFISPNEPDMDMLSQLAYWLGWQLTSGLGSPSLKKMLTDYYNNSGTGRGSQGAGGGTGPNSRAQDILKAIAAWEAKQ